MMHALDSCSVKHWRHLQSKTGHLPSFQLLREGSQSSCSGAGGASYGIQESPAAPTPPGTGALLQVPDYPDLKMFRQTQKSSQPDTDKSQKRSNWELFELKNQFVTVSHQCLPQQEAEKHGPGEQTVGRGHPLCIVSTKGQRAMPLGVYPQKACFVPPVCKSQSAPNLT